MNTLKNKVSLIGRIGITPETLKFESGHSLTKLSLATNEIYKNKNGDWQEVTQWHTINAWGKIGELINKKLSKGQKVLIEGRLVNQSYETKNGEKRLSTHVEAHEFLLLQDVEKETEKSII